MTSPTLEHVVEGCRLSREYDSIAPYHGSWVLSSSHGMPPLLVRDVARDRRPGNERLGETSFLSEVARQILFEMRLEHHGAPVAHPATRQSGPFLGSFPRSSWAGLPPFYVRGLRHAFTVHVFEPDLRPLLSGSPGDVRAVLNTVPTVLACAQTASAGLGLHNSLPWHTSGALEVLARAGSRRAAESGQPDPPWVLPLLNTAQLIGHAARLLPVDLDRPTAWITHGGLRTPPGQEEFSNLAARPDGTVLALDWDLCHVTDRPPLEFFAGVTAWAVGGGTISEAEATATIHHRYRQVQRALGGAPEPGLATPSARTFADRLTDLTWLVRESLVNDERGPAPEKLVTTAITEASASAKACLAEKAKEIRIRTAARRVGGPARRSAESRLQGPPGKGSNRATRV